MAGKIELGLERILRVLAALDNPQGSFPAVHVAGTNGKGSTCAFLASSLVAGGYRVGKFTSPYLLEPRDAVTIDGEVVDSETWERAVLRVRTAAKAQFSEDSSLLTTFELWTSAAFLIFAETSIDIAVIEVGVGGRTDATNVIPVPLAACISAIGMDHQNLLGPTLEDIAGHKAGIIKAGGWGAVTANQPEAVLQACRDQASTVGAQLQLAPPLVWKDRSARLAVDESTGAVFPVPLRGDFQLDNAGLALAALRHIAASCPSFSRLSDESTARGFASVTWQGRFERLTVRVGGAGPPESDTGSLDCWLDGGHNAHALVRVRQEIDALLEEAGRGPESASGEMAASPMRQRPVLFIYGGTESRDAHENLSLLLRPGDGVLAVPFPAPEGMPWIKCHPPATIVEAARKVLGVYPALSVAQACISLDEAFRAALSVRSAAAEGDKPLVVVCGSLYLVSEVHRSFTV